MKAVCVLEAILRKKDDEHFSIIASYFADRIDLVIKCSESPQSSLREKANRVSIYIPSFKLFIVLKSMPWFIYGIIVCGLFNINLEKYWKILGDHCSCHVCNVKLHIHQPYFSSPYQELLKIEGEC